MRQFLTWLVLLPVMTVSDTLIDLPHFKFLINNEICGPAENILILFVVSSAPHHSDYRRAQRETWGNVKKYATLNYKLAFMLGTVDDDEKQKNIEAESEKYGDIIQGNVVDSYANLTYKHVMAFKWALEFCGHANYVLKADDDVYVDIFRLEEKVRARFGENGKNLLVCGHIFDQNRPYRDKNNKYYVSYDEYPSDEPYPHFCSGAAILYSIDVVKRLYDVSFDEKYFKLEDIYVTAMLRKRIGVKEQIFEDYLEWNGNSIKKFINSKKVTRATFLFGLTTEVGELYDLWDKLMEWFKEKH